MSLLGCVVLLGAQPGISGEIVKIEKVGRPADGAAPETGLPMVDTLFTHVNEQVNMQDFHMGMGLSWGDYNNDGLPDLFVSGYHRHPDLLYRNKGDGTFTHTETDALIHDYVDGGRRAAGFGCAWGDYNNDGLLDLFVANVNGQQDYLWKNKGDGTFTQVAPEVGMADDKNEYGVAWGDYNGDGWLDLYLTTGENDMLYHNLGNGRFVEVAKSVGIVDTAPGFGVAWGDYDGDGDLDIYVANNGNRSDILYRNNGNGTFTNVSNEAGIKDEKDGMGVAWADIDNDGDLDVYVGNYADQQDFMYRNNGNGTFTQVAEEIGMRHGGKGRGVAWGDFDNDGDFDLIVANDAGQKPYLFRNNANGTFSEGAYPYGIIHGGWGIGAAWVDYDNDGDMDAYIGTQVTHVDFLWRNETKGPFNWIKVNPQTCGAFSKEGGDTGCKWRLAIGAWVEVDMDGGADFKKGFGRYAAAHIGGGDGLAGSAQPLHVGTRQAKYVDIRVRFPNGKVVTMTKVPAKQMVTVKDR